MLENDVGIWGNKMDIVITNDKKYPCRLFSELPVGTVFVRSSYSVDGIDRHTSFYVKTQRRSMNEQEVNAVTFKQARMTCISPHEEVVVVTAKLHVTIPNKVS